VDVYDVHHVMTPKQYWVGGAIKPPPCFALWGYKPPTSESSRLLVHCTRLLTLTFA